MSTPRRTKRLRPVHVTDPLTLAFLDIVERLSPAASADLEEAMRAALVDRRPANETRAAFLKFFRGAGYAKAEWRTDEMMRVMMRPAASSQISRRQR